MIHIFLFSLVLAFPNFLNFPFNGLDADSERNLLSALVQCEAAVLAIVISLTLVAIQLAASSYSSRIIDPIKKLPDLWILLSIYILSIFLGLSYLIQIKAESESPDMEYYISMSYILGLFAFLALIPYMWNVFNLLKPSNLLYLLSLEINKKNIMRVGRAGDQNDPIQPITDIIVRSIMNCDVATVADSLGLIELRIKCILQTDCDIDKIRDILFFHIHNMIGLAIERKDTYGLILIIDTIRQIGVFAIENV